MHFGARSYRTYCDSYVHRLRVVPDTFTGTELLSSSVVALNQVDTTVLAQWHVHLDRRATFVTFPLLGHRTLIQRLFRTHYYYCSKNRVRNC